MNIEDTNTVGKPASEIQEHVFACHDEIRHLRRLVKMHEASEHMRRCKESVFAEIEEAVASHKIIPTKPNP
jgi:hypothetical protein